MYVSKEQIAAAREMDLLTYLQYFEPEELIHFSGNAYTTRSHNSLKISNGKWCWWSQGIGGRSALDYLIKVRGLSLPEAVIAITGSEPIYEKRKVPENIKSEKLESMQFQLPKKHVDNRRVFSYLRGRGIDAEIINSCIKHGQLYEDGEHHNCVFVGFDGEEAKYGAVRSTLSGSNFKGDVPGSDKRYSFAVPKYPEKVETLCVFECAIDAISYLTLLKMRGQNWKAAHCLSLAGVYRPKKNGVIKIPLALEQYLERHAEVQTIIFCLDHDEIGQLAAAEIGKQLASYQVIYQPPKIGKDYNELLQKVKQINEKQQGYGKELC